ncbi:vesicle-trafficking protein SEC22c isoform X2 [Corythoichthys intestinalis]|nr:vesicle-trafficking protein SEC22c isoform X2 [Corythoichthys intestinalis]XP_061809759.1 vesicle-trafficking protein SEC22c-like [Nerophis lumbriciformis]
MSLILFAFVVRVRDGLPLSASTDFEHNRELQERKQQLRTISKTLAFIPEKAAVKGQDLNIYLVTSEGVSYMSVCHCSVPITMAFCFLEDLRWEFTACYNHNVVSLADRPYPFLEFDCTIQKLKQQYNHKGGPALEVTLAEVQEELRLRPPQILNLEEVELTNGSANGHVEQSATSGQNIKLEPVTALGILSLVLNIMCASLNVIRGVHLIEYTFQDDYDGAWNVVAFLVAFLCSMLQCHLYVFHSRLKTAKSLSLLSAIIICNLFLHGMRNAWQIAFHIGVASLSTVLILRRKVLDRSNDCGV